MSRSKKREFRTTENNLLVLKELPKQKGKISFTYEVNVNLLKSILFNLKEGGYLHNPLYKILNITSITLKPKYGYTYAVFTGVCTGTLDGFQKELDEPYPFVFVNQ
ncbi:hypothetical protein [Priestia aryabhattai]